MTLPDHVLIKQLGAPDQQGAGAIFFELQGAQLTVKGAATVAALEAAIASGVLDEATSLYVAPKCALPGLPANAERLRSITSVEIASSAFVDWASLYRLGQVERLLLNKDVRELGDGISAMRELRKLDADRAKHLAKLPSDFSALPRLETATVAAPLMDQLVAETTKMPSFLIGLRHELGLELIGDQLTIGARRKLGQRWSSTSQVDVLRHLGEAGRLDVVQSVFVDVGSELEAWPIDVPVTSVRTLRVKSPTFREWSSVAALPALETVVLEGNAGGALEGLSGLTSLRALHVRSKGVEALPPALVEAPSLEALTVPARLDAAREAFEEACRARRVSAALARFEAWLAQNAPDYLQGLAPGRTDFAEAEAALGRALPRELRALYAWRDGDTRDDGRFVFWRSFPSLASAVAKWKTLGEMARAGEWKDSGVQPPAVWVESWFPVLRWDNGWHLVVDLGSTWRGRAGQVIDVFMKDTDRAIVAPDLATYLELLFEALARGVSEHDGDVELRTKPASASGYPVRKTVRDKP